MTINIEELKRDREAGTPGEWVVHGRETKRSQIDVGCNLIGPTRRVAGIYQPFDGRLSADANARRIARLPDLEVAYIEAVERQERQYHVGPLTFDRVFRAGQLENLYDMQAVLDAVERALEAE